MAVLDQAQLGGVTYDLQDAKAQAMITPAFSAAQAYSAGDSVTYNGTLYTFTADHAAGAWIGTDAATVPGGVMGEVADLRSALRTIDDVIALIDSVSLPFNIAGVGYINSNGASSTGDGTGKCTDYIPIGIFTKLAYKNCGFTGSSTFYTATYNANKEPLRKIRCASNQESIGYLTDLVELTVESGEEYVRFSTFADTTTYGEFEVYGVSNPLLTKINEFDDAIDELDAEIETIKETIGGWTTVINTTEESPTQGYWSEIANHVLSRTDDSTTYYTLENPLDISSLKDGTTFTIKSSVTGGYGVYVADANMIVVDYVNGSNAEERGYSVTSNLQEITFTKTANMKYAVSDIRTTKYTGMSDFSITGISNNSIAILNNRVSELDNRVSELEDDISQDKDTYPTQTIIKDGGFCKIFQTIGVVGDSLSSGSMAPPSDSELGEDEEDTTDYLWYSWIQYMARYSGLTAYNFSMGGLSARGLRHGTSNPNVQEILANLRSNDKKCKAYYVALAHNDYNYAQDHPEYIIGTSADCNLASPDSNANTFYGNYAWVVSQIKAVQPNAKIFLITAKRQAVYGAYNTAIREMVNLFNTYYNNSNVYLIDMETYCPTIETDWEYSGGHGNAMGYLNYSYQVSSYTDWIIRHNKSDFKYVQFIGTGIL